MADKRGTFIVIAAILVFAFFVSYLQTDYPTGHQVQKPKKITTCTLNYNPNTGQYYLRCPGGFKCGGASNTFKVTSSLNCEKCGDQTCAAAEASAESINFQKANPACKSACQTYCGLNQDGMLHFLGNMQNTCTDDPQDDATVTVSDLYACVCVSV